MCRPPRTASPIARSPLGFRELVLASAPSWGASRSFAHVLSIPRTNRVRRVGAHAIDLEGTS